MVTTLSQLRVVVFLCNKPSRRWILRKFQAPTSKLQGNIQASNAKSRIVLVIGAWCLWFGASESGRPDYKKTCNRYQTRLVTPLEAPKQREQ